MASTIRLTINPQLQEGLSLLQERYPFMSYDEILKLAVSKLYAEEIDKINYKENKYTSDFLNEPGGVEYKSESDMGKWWKQNKENLRNKSNEENRN